MAHKSLGSIASLVLDGNSLSTEEVYLASKDVDIKASIGSETASKLEDSHKLLQKFIKEGRVIYGVNTSVGGFVKWLIPAECAQDLQKNLIAAVATNVGPYLEDRVVRASMLARLNSLARGTSAISLTNFNKLLAIFNSGICPCIPSKGSLGASGDLGPLACIALLATGRWKARYKNQILPGDQALAEAGIEPMELSFKEGLSLVNGTSVMTGYASMLLEESITLIKTYDIISALSLEALNAKKKPFDPVVHQQKPHPGQLQTAKNIWALLGDSKMIVDEAAVENELKNYFSTIPIGTKIPIEDSYAIRCTPQILGPIKDNLKWISTVVNNELNSSNDNPLILTDQEEVFHNGHFHGQYISMAMDQLSISLTTLSNLSDRRIDRFMDPHHSNGLPAFLCAEDPGLRLGLMGGQFMATSLTAENRSLCYPVSIQSLTSTGDFQDIVSMGLIAARRVQDIYNNTAYILAFELICAAQAAEIRGSNTLSKATKRLLEIVREQIPYLSSDQCLTDYIERVAEAIKSGHVLQEVERIFGKIML